MHKHRMERDNINGTEDTINERGKLLSFFSLKCSNQLQKGCHSRKLHKVWSSRARKLLFHLKTSTEGKEDTYSNQ